MTTVRPPVSHSEIYSVETLKRLVQDSDFKYDGVSRIQFARLLHRTGALWQGDFTIYGPEPPIRSKLFLNPSRLICNSEHLTTILQEAADFWEGKVNAIFTPVNGPGALASQLAEIMHTRVIHSDIDKNGRPITMRGGYRFNKRDKVLVCDGVILADGDLEYQTSAPEHHNVDLVGVHVIATGTQAGKEYLGRLQERLRMPCKSFAHVDLEAQVNPLGYGYSYEPCSLSATGPLNS